MSTGLSRKWSKIIGDYTSESAEVARTTAAVLQYTLFGGYVTARGGFPAPVVALRLWRDTTEDPAAFAMREAVAHPKIVLSAWQEHLIWLLSVLEPLQSVLSHSCDLEVFGSEVTERADECIRASLCRVAPPLPPPVAAGSAEPTAVTRPVAPESAAAALAAAEEAARRSYGQATCGDQRPTNRPDFTALFVRSVNTRIRNKETAAVGKPVPPPRDLARRSARPIGGCTVAALAKSAGVVAPWTWTIRGVRDAMALAEVPPNVERTVGWLETLYAARGCTDDSVKASLNRSLDTVGCAALHTIRACMASIAFTGAISVLPLAASTLVRQLQIVEPERRFLFVCPTHCVVGATYVSGGGVHRNLRFVSYGMGSDCIICNKQIKAPRRGAHGGPARADSRSKASCGLRMITVPTVGVALRIKGDVYATCEICGAYAKLDRGGPCASGMIVCPLHATATVLPSGDVVIPDEDPPAPPPPLSSDDLPDKSPCAVCRYRWRSAEPAGFRVRVRVLSSDGPRSSISVITCCARHVRAIVGATASGRLPRLPRLLSMEQLRRSHLEFACKQEAMRNPSNRRGATNLRAYLNASSLRGMTIGTADAAPPATFVAAPRKPSLAGAMRRKEVKRPARTIQMIPHVVSDSSPSQLPPPLPPAAATAARWDGRSSSMLDCVVSRLAEKIKIEKSN